MDCSRTWAPRASLLAATAYASMVLLDNIRGVTRHLHGGQYGQDTIEGMEQFFEHWTKACPLVFVKYDVTDALKGGGPHAEKIVD